MNKKLQYLQSDVISGFGDVAVVVAFVEAEPAEPTLARFVREALLVSYNTIKKLRI